MFLYPGDQRLCVGSSLSSYDADAAALVEDRPLEFLRRR